MKNIIEVSLKPCKETMVKVKIINAYEIEILTIRVKYINGLSNQYN